uniref:Uncharacterized protein n=2 Tax=Aegilops tauschii subsp. strangulata TaxID=200361 RepID=A0A453D069_AEGTS
MVFLIASPPSFSDCSTGEPIVIGSSSKGKGKKRRSKAWDSFDVIKEVNGQPIKARCKYCPTEIKCGTGNGTAGMLNHNKICKKKPGLDDQPPNSSSTNDTTANDATTNARPNLIGDSSSRKRRRVDEESAQNIAANTSTPWNKAELSNRIQQIISRLQDIRGEVSEVFKLHESDSASSLDHNRSTTSDQHLRTSSLISRQLYGRVAEKKSILKLMMSDDTSNSIIVLPIVGVAGVGKTALTQLVYNEPNVESRFQHRVWIWVSRNFDEVRITREMLNFVSREKHEEINCFVKLQEILKIHVKSKRVLIILDDVWDDMNDCRWNQLLAPFKFNSANGNVILVTTRKLSVAKMVGTTEPIKIGALEEDDFWLLFKSCALGDRASENPGNLCTIGRQIAGKLKGNPLAAVTAGALLRDHLTVDHWSNILKKEDWKSLGLSGGIMPALKLSYDELPYHLQRCLSYCSIFPNKHKFSGKDLIYIWISQGFVSCANLSKSLEEIGWQYLIDMTNMGLFQQVRGEESSSFFHSNCQTWYVMCGLMHDFARMISRTECATIDGLQCNGMMSTVRHLSIVTDSAYKKDQHGNILRNEKFEEYLRSTVTSVGKLRTLILLGHYDSFFSQLFKDIFKEAHNLHLLQMSATSADFSSFLCGLASAVHLRYLKLESDGLEGDFPQVLVNLFHLQKREYTLPLLA